jgi:DNA polymerase, archaea type
MCRRQRSESRRRRSRRGFPDRRVTSIEDEWLWGWDATPGIVSVWAENARAIVWRRTADTGILVREEERFRPWLLLDRLDDLLHLGAALGRDGDPDAQLTYRELDGGGGVGC